MGFTQEEQAKLDEERETHFAKMAQEIKEEMEKRQRRDDLLKFLDIPHSPGSLVISVDGLIDILMDDEKLKVLVSKLRNKAFW
jgi:hypothetical protein